MYHALVLSSNYVTKRQSLKLLGEILLDRANYNVMTRYIASETNLKVMMNFLRDKSKNIQFEAFHVFKVCQYSCELWKEGSRYVMMRVVFVLGGGCWRRQSEAGSGSGRCP
jgi:hypothetical protein